jgi:hypothetical protein
LPSTDSSGVEGRHLTTLNKTSQLMSESVGIFFEAVSSSLKFYTCFIYVICNAKLYQIKMKNASCNCVFIFQIDQMLPILSCPYKARSEASPPHSRV